MKLYFTWKRVRQQFWMAVANLPMPGHFIRPFFIKLGGAKLTSTECFIGKNVVFDGVCPERIHIEPGVVITDGTIVLTHYFHPVIGKWTTGDVYIKRNAFLGARTIITKPVTIGEGACVGAGSVVTKDIPDYEIWAGNPAKFIKKIPKDNKD